MSPGVSSESADAPSGETKNGGLMIPMPPWISGGLDGAVNATPTLLLRVIPGLNTAGVGTKTKLLLKNPPLSSKKTLVIEDASPDSLVNVKVTVPAAT